MNRQNTIVQLIAVTLGVSADDIKTDGRQAHKLYARYIAIAILREEGFSPEEIASVFTNYVPASIKHHCADTFNDLLGYNRKFKDMYLLAVKAVEELEDEIENNKKSA